MMKQIEKLLTCMVALILVLSFFMESAFAAGWFDSHMAGEAAPAVTAEPVPEATEESEEPEAEPTAEPAAETQEPVAEPAAESEEDADDEDADNEDDDGTPVSYVYQGDEKLVVKAINCTIKDHGTEYDFTDKGIAEFTVTTKKKPAYWIINGARYDFKTVPKTIRVRKLAYPMTIEAVTNAKKTVTLPTEEKLQAARNEEQQLVVMTKNADMLFLKSAKKTGGSKYREFDFTKDFVNPASGKEELGGRVTVHVTAAVPKGKYVSYWEMNEARLSFPSQIKEFTVTNLAENMLYQPRFGKLATYTVSCTGCTFSGGGYKNAKSGKVTAGTKITIKPSDSHRWHSWAGSHYESPSDRKSLTYTVNKNCTFRVSAIVY